MVVRQVLGRDGAWVSASRSVLAGVTYATNGISEDVRHARAAFNAAATGQFDAAVAEMSAAVNASIDPRVKGWHQEQLAVYQHQLDPVQAQQSLAGAVRLNPRVTKPLAGVTYTRLSAVGDQAEAAARYLAESYTDRNILLVGIEALVDALAFDPDHTEEFEAGLEWTASHLGFKGQRPERDLGNGPDVLWSTGAGAYMVIECKSGATSSHIWRKDMAQLAHSLNWFEKEYGGDRDRIPVLVHQVAQLAKDAVAPAGCRVMTKGKIDELREALRGLGVAVANGDRWAEPSAVEEQLRHRRLIGGEFIKAYSVRPRSAR